MNKMFIAIPASLAIGFAVAALITNPEQSAVTLNVRLGFLPI